MIAFQRLPKEFTRDGGVHTLRLVMRTDTKAIYTLWIGEKFISHEIIKISVAPGGRVMPKGDILKPREVYPLPSRWGEEGWTIYDKNKALEKYNSLP